VYPYPEEVKYSGHGSTLDAANFVGYLPSTLNGRWRLRTPG
jgi:hypothetical protein